MGVTQERGTPQYKVEMKLTIRDAGEANFGKYTCVAKNPRGQTDGSITLYAREPPTTTAAPTTPLTYKVALPQPDSNQGYNEHTDLAERAGPKRRRKDHGKNKDRYDHITTQSSWYNMDPVSNHFSSSARQSFTLALLLPSLLLINF